MPQPQSTKAVVLLISLAIAGTGVALYSAARDSQVRQFTPQPGVAPDGTVTLAPTPAPTVAATTQPMPSDIQWRPDFETAMREARSSGKPVMVDFYTDWCGYCKKLDAEVYTDIGVIAESVNFISVKINAEKQSDLAAKYQVSGFPTILWLDANGAPIERLPGYADAPEFLQIMRGARGKVQGSAI